MMLFEMESKEKQNSSEQTAWIEVNNYSSALAQGYDELRELPLCFRLIKKLHATLPNGVRGCEKRPGEFRDQQVHLGSNQRYVPPPPLAMNEAMNELETYVNSNCPSVLDPLVRCFIVHYQLEAIHPFSDGNGRIGRVLLSLMILIYKWCNLSMPWLYLSPYFDRYKNEYINNMFNVSARGDWSKWVEFCLRGTIEQAKDAIIKCSQPLALKKDMEARITHGSHRIHPIIEALFNSPYVRITDLAKIHNVAYQTARLDIDLLVAKNILRPSQGVKIKTFFAPEIFKIAYVNEAGS